MVDFWVASMMTADTVGKIPSILSVMATASISKKVFGRVAQKAPRLAKGMVWTSAVGGVVYAVINARSQIRNRELTEHEKERMDVLVSGMRENTQGLGVMVVELAERELAQLTILHEEASSESERKQIQQHINEIKEKLGVVYAFNGVNTQFSH